MKSFSMRLAEINQRKNQPSNANDEVANNGCIKALKKLMDKS